MSKHILLQILIKITLFQENKIVKFFNEFKNFISDPKKFANCKYYDINQIKSLKICNEKRSLSLFQFNTCSLLKILMAVNA